MRGNPLTLIGPALTAGQKAPDFKLVDNSLKDVTLADTGSQVRIISVVPSLDTPVCDAQTKRFNEEAAKLPGVVAILWAVPAQPEVSLTTLARLTPGMSEADVAGLFGLPTADVTGQPPTSIPPPVAGGRLLEYSGRRATVTVEFDADGRLVRTYPVIHEVSGLERVRIRLNWW